MKILLASHNKGKINEFVNLLSDLNIEFCLLDEFEKVEEPLEYGETLVENALIKAKYYYDLFKLPVINNVFLPILAEAKDASQPACPPPTTITSYFAFFLSFDINTPL